MYEYLLKANCFSNQVLQSSIYQILLKKYYLYEKIKIYIFNGVFNSEVFSLKLESIYKKERKGTEGKM